MKKLLLPVIAGCMMNVTAIAQQHHCGTDEYIQAQIATQPELAKQLTEQYEQIRLAAEKYLAEASGANKATASGTIPVVFHVILTNDQINQIGGVNNVYQRVYGQLDVLNADFNARNSDAANIPEVFKPLRGNPQISFGLARRTPNGKSTSGVEIRVTTESGFNLTSGNQKHYSLGGLDAWDVKKYLNVWVVNLTDNGVLGFALHPALANTIGSPEEAGVTLDYGAFGRKSSLSDNTFFLNNIDKGRTMVHEAGHYFTLFHIWGNTQVGSGVCSDDDEVGDTPQQKDANYGCPTFPKANCTNSAGGEMFMNYMDYVNDACMNMFTKGQVSRINAQLSNVFYKDLFTHPELLEWPTGISGVEERMGLNIYPNPATSEISVSGTGIKAIIFTNLMGQNIKTIDNPSQQETLQINTSEMMRGIYLMQCTTTEGTVTRKITLQ